MSTEIKVKLVSKKHVKLFALAMAQKRAHRFTRVSGEFYLKCEANLKVFIRDYIHTLPSAGRTIR